MPVFDVAKWVWKKYLKRSIFAQYTVLVLTEIFSFFYQSFTLQSSTIDTIANKMPGPFAPKLWIVCSVFRAKNSEIRPIRPIPNVHAHTIIIVFASSKPIGIEYCFDELWIKCLRLNGARLNNWIYWWTIEFIQFNFSIAHRWRKDGCQQVYELGLDQLHSSVMCSTHAFIEMNSLENFEDSTVFCCLMHNIMGERLINMIHPVCDLCVNLFAACEAST